LLYFLRIYDHNKSYLDSILKISSISQDLDIVHDRCHKFKEKVTTINNTYNILNTNTNQLTISKKNSKNSINNYEIGPIDKNGVQIKIESDKRTAKYNKFFEICLNNIANIKDIYTKLNEKDQDYNTRNYLLKSNSLKDDMTERSSKLPKNNCEYNESVFHENSSRIQLPKSHISVVKKPLTGLINPNNLFTLKNNDQEENNCIYESNNVNTDNNIDDTLLENEQDSFYKTHKKSKSCINKDMLNNLQRNVTISVSNICKNNYGDKGGFDRGDKGFEREFEQRSTKVDEI